MLFRSISSAGVVSALPNICRNQPETPAACALIPVSYTHLREGDGYGLSRNAIRSIHDKGCKLIVTVDNGISAVEEADDGR